MKEFIPILDNETTPEVYDVNDDYGMPELEDATDDSSIGDATDDEDMPELVDSRELVDENELLDDSLPELAPNVERSIRIIYIFIFFQSFLT